MEKKVGNDYRIRKPESSKDLAFEVAAALDDFIEFHDGEIKLLETITSATTGQRAVYSCYWYQYEVNNGGHKQYFSNSTGILWEYAIAGLKLMNTQKYLDILNDAISLFPDVSPAKDREIRNEQLFHISKDDLDKLDGRFYDLNEKDDIDKIISSFIENHPFEFFHE